jgi:hypothetical protein
VTDLVKSIADIESGEPPKIDDLVGEYVEIRDALSEARRNFKVFEKQSKEDMEKIESNLLEIARKLGVQNFKTQYGTAMCVDKDFARVAGADGWAKLCEYMVKTNDFGLVEKRVAKLHFKEIMNEEGVAPQDLGVEYVVEQVIQVRRS